MNRAARLLAIYDKFLQHGLGTDVPMSKVWANVFDIPPDDRHLEDLANSYTQSLRTELELLRLQFEEMGAPEDLLYTGLNRFRNYCAPGIFNQSWNGIREEANKPENRLTFQWASWVLREQEQTDVSNEEIKQLLSDLCELEKSLKESDMGDYLRRIIVGHIDSIKIALNVYPIAGSKALDEAVQKIAGVHAIKSEKIDEAVNAASDVSKTIAKRVFGIARNFVGMAEKFNQVSDAAEKIAGYSEKVETLLIGLSNKI